MRVRIENPPDERVRRVIRRINADIGARVNVKVSYSGESTRQKRGEG